MTREQLNNLKSKINPNSSTDFLKFFLLTCYKGVAITDDTLNLLFSKQIIDAAKNAGIITFNEFKNRYDFPYVNYARKSINVPSEWFELEIN